MASTTEAQQLADNVKTRRAEARLSLDVLYARTTHLLPESMWGSTEMIRRLEAGTLEKPNPFWVAAIAKALGCGIRDLSPTLAADLERLVILAGEVSSPGGSTQRAGRTGRPSPNR